MIWSDTVTKAIRLKVREFLPLSCHLFVLVRWPCGSIPDVWWGWGLKVWRSKCKVETQNNEPEFQSQLFWDTSIAIISVSICIPQCREIFPAFLKTWPLRWVVLVLAATCIRPVSTRAWRRRNNSTNHESCLRQLEDSLSTFNWGPRWSSTNPWYIKS